MFTPGRKYSRSDVSNLLGLGPKAKGGIWVSGIREHKNEFFIFTNVGTSGTIGEDFGNRWEGRVLRWYHKKVSHLGWPSVQRLLDAGRAHVFWRSSTRDLFEYAGYGRKVQVGGTSPVEILWSFEDSTPETAVHEGQGAVDQETQNTGLPSALTVGSRARHPRLGVGRVLEVSVLVWRPQPFCLWPVWGRSMTCRCLS